MLLVGGAAQRWLERVLAASENTPVQLERPLDSLPLRIDAWRGADIPLDEQVVEVTGTDAHLYRRFVNDETGEQIQLYVGYAARPALMLGHRPEVCYAAHGWVLTADHADRVRPVEGEDIDVVIDHFTRPGAAADQATVLNYYVLNGREVADWRTFNSPRWRLPNLSRDPHFYVAQVQVSTFPLEPMPPAKAEEIVKHFASGAAGRIRALLPAPAESARGAY